MDFELVVLLEAFAAVWAAVRFLTSVYSFVNSKLALMSITLSTQVAGEWSFSSVGALVVPQQIGTTEVFAADIAAMCLICTVSLHVDVKGGCAAEAFATNTAREDLALCSLFRVGIFANQFKIIF